MGARVTFNGQKIRSVDHLRREVAEMLRFWEGVWNEAEEMLSWLNPAAAALGIERDEDGLAILLPEPARSAANDLIEIKDADADEPVTHEGQHEIVHKTPPEIRREEPEPERPPEMPPRVPVTGPRPPAEIAKPPMPDMRAVGNGARSASERKKLVLDVMRTDPERAWEGPELRERAGLAHSDFHNTTKLLIADGSIADLGYKRGPDTATRGSCKLWKLLGDGSPVGDAGTRISLSAEAEFVKENGPGTVEGRVLAELQAGGAAPAHIAEKLELDRLEVDVAIRKLEAEGEIERMRGGFYKAVPITAVR